MFSWSCTGEKSQNSSEIPSDNSVFVEFWGRRSRSASFFFSLSKNSTQFFSSVLSVLEFGKKKNLLQYLNRFSEQVFFISNFILMVRKQGWHGSWKNLEKPWKNLGKWTTDFPDKHIKKIKSKSFKRLKKHRKDTVCPAYFSLDFKWKRKQWCHRRKCSTRQVQL